MFRRWMILIGLVTLLTTGYAQLPYKRFAIEKLNAERLAAKEAAMQQKIQN